MQGRLLVLNSHEAWVAQLRHLPFDLDIGVGLKGRLTSGWDERMRPLPPRARTVPLDRAIGEFLAGRVHYRAVLVHNLSDLLAVKELELPKLLVLHTTLEGRIEEEGAAFTPEEVGQKTAQYLDLIGAHALAVSELKRRSWGLSVPVATFAVDPNDYAPATYEVPEGLRISNQFRKRGKILLTDFHDAAFSGLPVRLIGENPDIPGAKASSDWTDLRNQLRRARFYVHTAHPALEDGYNMATVEAMAAGLPVLGNCHPTSPIIHGQSGYLSDDPRELRTFAERLLAHPELARELGTQAQQLVELQFSPRIFTEKLLAALEQARLKFRTHRGLPRHQKATQRKKKRPPGR